MDMVIGAGVVEHVKLPVEKRVAGLYLSPKQFDEAWPVRSYTRLDSINVAVRYIVVECLLVGNHMKCQGVIHYPGITV